MYSSTYLDSLPDFSHPCNKVVEICKPFFAESIVGDFFKNSAALPLVPYSILFKFFKFVTGEGGLLLSLERHD